MRGKVCLIGRPGLARDSFYLHLSQKGHQVWTTSDLPSAISLIRKEGIQAVVLELDLPEVAKNSAVKDLLAQERELLILALVDYPESEKGLKAIKEGAWSYLTRPVDMEELEIVLERSLQARDLKRRLQLLQANGFKPLPSEKIICKSKVMRAVVQSVQRIGKGSQAPLLLSGETGTGKEFLARWMHSKTRGPGYPFLSINCASLSQKRLLSELFGPEQHGQDHVSQQLEKMELASEGTVLLKSIESLNPPWQRKLARYLTLKEGQPAPSSGGLAGSSLPRIISTTAVCPESLQRSGPILPELLYRINTFTLVVPPLRHRREDIIPLAQQFLRSFARAKGWAMSKLDKSAQRKLEKYPWPGNTAELKKVMERAILVSRGGVISAEDLSPAF